MDQAEVGLSDDHAIVDVHAGDDVSPLAGSLEVDPTHSAVEFIARAFTLVRGRFTYTANISYCWHPTFASSSETALVPVVGTSADSIRTSA